MRCKAHFWTRSGYPLKGCVVNIDGLVELLPAEGAMSFVEFIVQARAANLPAGLWLRAKHQGKLFSWLDASGNHWVSRNPEPVEQGASNG